MYIFHPFHFRTPNTIEDDDEKLSGWKIFYNISIAFAIDTNHLFMHGREHMFAVFPP
jgi:hypothetical protein